MMRTSNFLSSCAIGALLAAIPGIAAAQALQGTPTVVVSAPSTPVISTAPNYTGVFVRGPQTVINWAPFDTGGVGTIDFLPASSLVEFTDPGGVLGSFTVLNRVMPVNASGIPVARPIALNGTVIGLSGNTPGGQIWFYSPTGIIAGPTSVFNVGSLILTTNDIQFVPDNPLSGTTGSIYGPGGLVQFRGPAGSTGFVEVQAGAQLNAIAPSDAYVALVAPRVVQGGRVSVNGQVGYIAAEQVDMTINAGLFDFTLLVGTTDANGIVHTGETTGPNPADAFDTQTISMVALPKNDALTMLLSGAVGYEDASGVSTGPGYVDLVAGFTVADPLLNAAADPGNRLGSISIGNATFRNGVDAYASGDITVAPSGGTTHFERSAQLTALNDIGVIAGGGEQILGDLDLNLYAGERGAGGDIVIEANGGGTIDIARQFQADADSRVFYGDTLGDATGGTISITANGGTIHFIEGFIEGGAASGSSAVNSYTATGGTIVVSTLNGGSITIDNFLNLNAFGDASFSAGDGIGGSVSVSAMGGTLSVADLGADVSGSAGFGNAQGGMGVGGDIAVSAAGGGTITASNFAGFSANGRGGGSGTQGGDGFGGAANLSASDATLAFGSVSIRADGFGGTAPAAGDGVGGTVAIDIAGEAQSWLDVFAGARGRAGGGGAGSGISQADAVTLSIDDGGSLTLVGDLFLAAGAGTYTGGTSGFAGGAGGIEVTVANGGALTVGGTLSAEASAEFAGEGPDPSATHTPDQLGGTVTIVADGGNITATMLDVAANADAGGQTALTLAGTVTGGTVTVTARNGANIRVDDGAGTAQAHIAADAFGASGPAPADAFGGTARLIAEDGSITVSGNIEVSANAATSSFFAVPPAGPGFTAEGGTASVELLAGTLGTAFVSGNDLGVTASGDGRLALTSGDPPLAQVQPIAGDGGDGTGGLASVTVAAGELSFGAVTLDSSGIGGIADVSTGSAAFQSGDGFGGISQLSQDGGTTTITTLELISAGTGGGAPDATGSGLAALAGNGTAGSALVALSGFGTLQATDVILDAQGTGGAGTDHTGAGAATGGGTGTGGTARLAAAGGWAGSITTGTWLVQSDGQGGVGGASATGTDGDGGDGAGGLAAIDLGDGRFSLGAVAIEANGIGGYSGDASSGVPGSEGGIGTGGQARFALIDSPSGALGTRTLDSLFIDASGLGGFGSISVAQSAVGDVDFTVSVLDPASALDLTGGLSLYASGLDVGAASGIDALISGAPLDVGGDLLISTGGPIAVTATDPLRAQGSVVLNGSSVTATGLIQSGTFMTLTGNLGMDTGRLTSGGTTELTSTGPIDVDTLASAGTVAVTGGAVDIGGAGDLTFTTAQAEDTMSIVTSGNLAFASVGSSNAMTLRSTGGSLTVTGDLQGGFPNLAAAGNILIGGELRGAGSLSVMAGGSFTVVDDAFADDANITAAGGINMRSLRSGEITTLIADNGNIVVPELLAAGRVTARGRDVDIASTGGLFFDEATATAGDVTILTDDFLTTAVVTASGLADLRTDGTLHTLGDVTAATIDMRANADVLADAGLLASGSLSALARGTFNLSGLARGTAITIASGNIALAGGAQLGSRGVTNNLTLTNLNVAAVMNVGGSPQSGYSLDQAEAARLFADDGISIGIANLPLEPGYGRIAVRDLALTFGPTGNIGTGGQLEISTPAEIAITGNVALTTSGTDDTFLIDPTLVELDSSTGSIALLNGSGTPTGRLEIVGDTIAIASTAALTQLRTLSDMAAINTLLDTPGGTAAPLQAGTIAIDADDALFVQNSGATNAYADRRGFTAGALEIATGSATTRISINGQILTAGGPVGGLDTAPLIRINGAAPAGGGQFDTLSTINGCVIGANCVVVPEPELTPPTSEDIESPLPREGEGSLFVAPLIELAGNEPLISPPLVDEPITGVGNDDLWEPSCDAVEDGACPEGNSVP